MTRDELNEMEALIRRPIMRSKWEEEEKAWRRWLAAQRTVAYHLKRGWAYHSSVWEAERAQFLGGPAGEDDVYLGGGATSTPRQLSFKWDSQEGITPDGSNR